MGIGKSCSRRIVSSSPSAGPRSVWRLVGIWRRTSGKCSSIVELVVVLLLSMTREVSGEKQARKPALAIKLSRLDLKG